MQFTSLQQWLEWLEHRHPTEIDLGLERIREVAARLDLLAPVARVLTVAGTNGKGSCVATAAALLHDAGLNVGVYTSPHLLHYNERIVINGVAVGDSEICDSFSRIFKASGPISLTYFEFGTLAALDIFHRHNLDVMVLEVGLGGRLDAVNILDPDVAVITSIDLDHQDWLGTDREAIGAEKAGIMRSNRPAICADRQPPASLLAHAKSIGAHISLLDDVFGYAVNADSWRWWTKDASGKIYETGLMPLPHLPLPSLAAALQAVTLLGVDLSSLPVAQRLSALGLPGRFQMLDFAGRQVILDVAHNPAASAYLAQRLKFLPHTGRTFAIVGMMADKDRMNSLRNLESEIDSWYLARLPAVPRAATVEQLTGDLAGLNRAADGQGTVAECLAQLSEIADTADRIVIWGSFHTVAAALAALQSPL